MTPGEWALTAAVTGAAVGSGLLWRFTKQVRWSIRDAFDRYRKAVGTLVGWPEIRDPSDEKLIREAIPGIGERFDALEARLGINILEEVRVHASLATSAANYSRRDADAAKASAHGAAVDAADAIRRVENLEVNVAEVRQYVGMPVMPAPHAHRRAADDSETK